MRDGGLTIADLGSTAGTFVNGRKIDRPTPLTPGIAARVGPYTLTLTLRRLSGTNQEIPENTEGIRQKTARAVARKRPVLSHEFNRGIV